MEGLQGLINVAFYALVGLALSVAGFFFVMGVFNYMSAGGDQQKIQQGVAGMRNAIIGAVMIGGAGLIINFIVLDIIRPGGGDAGSLGQSLSCDQLLQSNLQNNATAVANAKNVHLVIKNIQARKECPFSSWNPKVDNATPVIVPGGSVDSVSIPRNLCTDNTCNKKPKGNPVRDAQGNILIKWKAPSGDITQTQNRAGYWLFTASSGSWWAQ